MAFCLSPIVDIAIFAGAILNLRLHTGGKYPDTGAKYPDKGAK